MTAASPPAQPPNSAPATDVGRLPEHLVYQAISDVFLRAYTGAAIESIKPLTPDASLRRYFRIRITAPVAGADSFVAMFFDSVRSPEAAGGERIDGDDAYVMLTDFLRAGGVRVPRIIVDARPDSIIILEDLGDVQLATCISEQRPGTARLLDDSLEQIVRIQSIPIDPSFFACRRSFSAPLYAKEMTEFRDYILVPRKAPASLIERFDAFSSRLAEDLGAEPTVLAHRDFHAWNLMVHENEIRVIDFQDALLATAAYDVVSLLNDRDMDTLLGEDEYSRLVRRFQTMRSADAQATDAFPWLYDRVLLQRDFKVAGRFGKLSTERGLTQYEQWIPGTVRRIGRTLQRVIGRPDGNPAFRTELPQLLDELTALLPDIEHGRQTPWKVFP